MQTSDQDKSLKIGFVGTFEVTNYGDCLFPVVYQKLLEQRLPDCRFAYYSPRQAEQSPLGGYGPIEPLPETLSHVHFNADRLVLCGGETLSLGHSAGTYNFTSLTLSAFARMWLAPLVAQSCGGIQFFVHCVGMPTVDFNAQPLIAEGLRHASRVSVRDKISSKRLEGQFPIEVDPMFAMSTCLTDDEWTALAQDHLPDGYVPGEYLCAHVSAPYLSNGLREWCEQIFEAAQQRGLSVLLMPICHFLWDRETLDAARALLIEMGLAPERVQFPLDGHKEVLATAALLGKSGAVITSSLHALVSAVSFGVPFAGFGGHGKVDGKHRQTLAAAGLEFGVAAQISDLAETLHKSRVADLAAAKEEAISRSLRDFDLLVAALTAEHRAEPASPMPQDLIDSLVELDLAPTRNLKFEVKRSILRLVKRSKLIDSLFVARRRARLLKSVAN